MILHVGCGPCYIPEMVNIDNSDLYKADILGNVLDMDFNNVELIWSCHFLEHLSYPNETVKCLDLFYGWLNKGGLLLLAVPDLEKIATQYVNRDQKIFGIYGGTTDWAYYKKHSIGERFNFFIRSWEHKITFDYDLLSELLRDAGFINVRRREFETYSKGRWGYDRMPEESLYVEAEK